MPNTAYVLLEASSPQLLKRAREQLEVMGVRVRDVRVPDAQADGAGWTPEQIRPALKRAGMSKRQLECLELALNGLSNDQIAEALELSTGTVAHHLTRGYGKIGVHSRAELFCWVRALPRSAYGPAKAKALA